jgi:hypothetical protein
VHTQQGQYEHLIIIDVRAPMGHTLAASTAVDEWQFVRQFKHTTAAPAHQQGPNK